MTANISKHNVVPPTPGDQPPHSQVEILTLETFLKGVAGTIAAVPASWVRCEIVNIRKTAKYIQFELADQHANPQVARVRGGCWPGAFDGFVKTFASAGVELCSGIRALVFLVPRLSTVHGFEVEVADIDPAYSLGDIASRADTIRARVVAAGIWDLNRNLPRPTDFTDIAVISPSEAAGLGDFKATLDRLQQIGLTAVQYFEAPFQGRDAAARLVQVLREVRSHCQTGRFNAVVMIRGGGATTDFSCLVDHGLVAAACGMPRPIITGIGHERDRTLLDEVAAVPLGTPSKAAAYIREAVILAAHEAARSIDRIRVHATASLDVLGTRVMAASTAGERAAWSVIDRSQAGLTSIQSQMRLAGGNLTEESRNRVATLFSEIVTTSHTVVQDAELGSRIAAQGIPASALAALHSDEAAITATLLTVQAGAPAALEEAARRVDGVLAGITKGVGTALTFIEGQSAAVLRSATSSAAAQTAYLEDNLSSATQTLSRAPDRVFQAGAEAKAAAAQARAGAVAALATLQVAVTSSQVNCLEHARQAADLAGQLIAALLEAVKSDARRILEAATLQVGVTSAAAEALDPGNVLAAGYALLRDGSGRPLTRVGQVRTAGRITAELTDGLVELEQLKGHV